MIKNAKENKKLIVEGTGGNTGIGLTVIGNALGYKTKIVMPENQSIEKINLLKYLGAEVVLTKQLPFTDPNNYIQLAKRIAKEENAIWTDQFDNLANREAHIKTTSQEIWSQTNGTIDAFICSVGTGGTLSGNFIGLKEKNKVAIATVISTWGSAPRQVGGQMAINETGEIIGSVSGGCVENSVITEALDSLKDKKHRIKGSGAEPEAV